VIELESAGDALDVIGTIVGAMGFAPTRQTLPSRVGARAGNLVRQLVFKILVNGKLRSVAEVRGPVYLSNVVVLERPLS
jgi:hypothetical protein